MIKNVVFDFGGVIVGYDPAAYMKELFGDGPAGEYILNSLFAYELVKQLDMGLTTRERAYAPVLEAADRDGFGDEMRYVIGHWFEDMMGTKEDTVELVKKLRDRGVGVYYLTNMPEDLWGIFCARGLRDIFDGGVASFPVHVTKPDPKIYRLLLENEGLRAEETFFLDDMERNIIGGRAVGIDGMVFTDAASAERALRNMGVL